LNEVFADHAAAKLLSTAAFGDMAEIHRGEAEALDEINYSYFDCLRSTSIAEGARR
jgi:hypothetical protein